MKPLSIVLSMNAALAAVILLLLWFLLDVAKLAALGCGSAALLNLALSGLFFMNKERSFGIAFLAGFLLLAAVTGVVLFVLINYFPAELEMLRSRAV